MYVAEYDIGGTPWQQAAVRLRYPAAADEEQAERWWARLRALLRSLDGVPESSVSLRIQPERLPAALFLVAPASHAALLRQSLGSLTQLEVLADAEVAYPRESAEHDALLEFPRFRCRAALPALVSGVAWFAFDFRVSPLLNEVMREARGLGHALAYHVNVEALPIAAEWQKQAARNALRVAEVPGVPAHLEGLQRSLSEKLRHATHICEEYLGVETRAACEWLGGGLERRFCEAYGRHLTPEFRFDDNGHEGPLTATRHAGFFEPLRVDEVCSGAITVDERLEMLSWRPDPDILERTDRHVLEPGAMTPPAEGAGALPPPDYSGLPPPYAGKEPYVFVSYKREDLERIKPLLADVNRTGHRIWYDKGIPGGAEWDAVIEERVQNCTVLLLFLSRAAVRSKYVRREVKFADTLSKLIVTVRLERNVDLSHGIAMLLNQYQVIEGSAPGLGEELGRAVRLL